MRRRDDGRGQRDPGPGADEVQRAVRVAKEIQASLRPFMNAFYDEAGAVGRRYRRQDEIGTPWCITVDGDTLDDKTVTLRDRDTLDQTRIPIDKIVEEINGRLRG